MKDLEDKETEEKALRLMSKCRKECSHIGCHIQITMTAVVPFWDGGGDRNTSMTFEVMSPHRMATFVNTHPIYTFPDFFIHICSSLGIWFGLSILSPVRWSERKFSRDFKSSHQCRCKERSKWILVRGNDVAPTHNWRRGENDDSHFRSNRCAFSS